MNQYAYKKFLQFKIIYCATLLNVVKFKKVKEQ